MKNASSIRPVGEGEVLSSGSIEALSIEIKSRGNPYSTAINLEGQLTANKVNEVGGRIFLAADNGDIHLGDITADADITVNAAAGNIQMLSGSSIEADESITMSASEDIQLSELRSEGNISIGSGGVIANANIDASIIDLTTYGQVIVSSTSTEIIVNVQPFTIPGRLIVVKPSGEQLNSPLFTNFKKDTSPTGSMRSPFVGNDDNTGLIAKFSAQSSNDGKSIINLDR